MIIIINNNVKYTCLHTRALVSHDNPPYPSGLPIIYRPATYYRRRDKNRIATDTITRNRIESWFSGKIRKLRRRGHAKCNYDKNTVFPQKQYSRSAFHRAVFRGNADPANTRSATLLSTSVIIIQVLSRMSFGKATPDRRPSRTISTCVPIYTVHGKDIFTYNVYYKC